MSLQAGAVDGDCGRCQNLARRGLDARRRGLLAGRAVLERFLAHACLSVQDPAATVARQASGQFGQRPLAAEVRVAEALDAVAHAVGQGQ